MVGEPVRARARRLVRRCEDAFDALFYERRLGVDTGGVLVVSEDARNQPYEATRWRALGRILPQLGLTAQDVLLDAGCGKGRAVLQTARLHPFARVVGFDLSPELVAVARRNVERNRRRLLCTDIELVVADASVWPLPDDVTLIVANNPFAGELWRGFLQHVLESHERRPRRIRLLYLHPRCAEATVATERFRLQRAWPASVRGPEAHLYEVLPAAHG